MQLVRAKLCADAGSSNDDPRTLKCAMVWLKLTFWSSFALVMLVYLDKADGQDFPLICGTVLNGTNTTVPGNCVHRGDHNNLKCKAASCILPNSTTFVDVLPGQYFWPIGRADEFEMYEEKTDLWVKRAKFPPPHWKIAS